MTKPLDPPPSGKDFVWYSLKDWLFKLWTLFIAAINQLAGLTFGSDSATYSAAIRGLSAPSDGLAGFMGQYIGPTIVLAAVNNSGFSAPANADTTITGWTVTIDTANGLTSSSTYTIQEPGLYLIQLNLLYNNIAYVAGGYGACRIAKNGTQISNGLTQNGVATTASPYVNTNTQILTQCKAGDLITTQSNQLNNGTTANTLYSGGLYNNWTIVKVG